jgi:hypothetical protein
MRISDTHSLPILGDLEATVYLGKAVLAQCAEELEWFASNRKPLKLQLSYLDLYVIEKLYTQPHASLEIKLAATIEDVLEKIKIPYIFFPILRPDITRLVFYSRVAYR